MVDDDAVPRVKAMFNSREFAQTMAISTVNFCTGGVAETEISTTFETDVITNCVHICWLDPIVVCNPPITPLDQMFGVMAQVSQSHRIE